MKNILSILFVVIFSVGANAQVIAQKIEITLLESKNNDLTAQSGDIEFSFVPEKVYLTIKAENKSDKNQTIIWDKSSFIINKKASKVMMENVAKINKNNPLPNEEVPTKTYIERNIFPLNNWHDRIAMSDLFNWKYVRAFNQRNDNNYEIKLIVAVQSDDEIQNHEFTFSLDPVKK